MLLAAAGPFAYYVRDSHLLVLLVILQELIYQIIYLVPCFLVGRLILRRGIQCEVNTTFGIASSIAVGLGLVGFATLALGLMGHLTAIPAWGVLLASTALGLLDWKDLSDRLSNGKFSLTLWLKAPSEGGWMWVVSALLLAISIIGATLISGVLWSPDDPHPYDSMIYHLQVPREWFELGKIVPLKHNVYSFFPFNVEMHYLLGDILRGSPYAAMQMNQFFSVSLTVLSALAIRGWVRQRCGGRAAALAATAVLTLPWVIMLAAVTYVESGLLLWSTLSILWFVNALQSRRVGHFVLAGIMCGLACGTKFTGVPMLMAGLPAAGLLALALNRFATCPITTWFRGSFVFLFIAALTLSPWLIRNYAWARNPVFPNAAGILGSAHFSQTQVERWEKAHSPAAEHHAWSVRGARLLQEILLSWRYNYVLFPFAAVSLYLNRKRPDAVFCAGLIAVILISWLTQTHLMGRFFVVAALPAGILVGMLPKRWLAPATLLVALSAVNSWVGATIPWEGPRAAGNIDALFSTAALAGRLGAFGSQDYKLLNPEGLDERMAGAPETVLIGDGRVFNHQTPMEKLHYVTVFDLNTDGGRDAYDVYYGPSPAKAPPDALLVIDPMELARLAKTYWKVPAVPLPPPARFKNYLIIGPDGQIR